MASRTRRLAVAVVVTTIASGSAIAQTDTTVRFNEQWRPFLGCWTNANGATAGGSFCVVPTSDSRTVDVVSAIGDSIVNHTSLSATGTRIPRSQDGCTGFETGTWSSDTHRLYTHAEYTCARGRKVTSDGMFTMTTARTFTRIEAVPVKGGSNVRVRNYVVRTEPSLIPKSLVSRLPSAIDDPAIVSRAEAAADLTPADVADAATHLDAAVVDAWLAVRGQQFSLNAEAIHTLREAKVSQSTIAAMVSGQRAVVASSREISDAVRQSLLGGSGTENWIGEVVPYWLVQMRSAPSNSRTAYTYGPCFNTLACEGLYNSSTGEYFVKHTPVRSNPGGSQTVTDNTSMSGAQMSLQTPNSAAMSPSASAPTITGKP